MNGFETLRRRIDDGLFDTTIRARRERLRKLSGWLKTHRAEIEQALAEDLGKPGPESSITEYLPALQDVRQALKQLEAWAAPRPAATPLMFLGTRAQVRWEPKGLVLILAPWNFPFVLTVGPLISAVAAGNAVFLKPSEFAPHTTSCLQDLVESCFPAGEVVLCPGGKETAEALLDLPFDHVFFTGSTRVGRAVMQRAAAHPTSVTLELGGKSPVLIDPSADLEDAARKIAFGKFINAGQACIAPDFALVPERLQDRFVERLKNETRRMWPDPERADFSRIIHSDHVRRLQKQLDEAVQQGARIVFGGESDAEKRYFAPTVVVQPAGSLLQDEVFGPILPVVSYRTEEDAKKFLRSLPTPLAFYVFGRNRKATQAWIDAIPSGTAAINDTMLQFLHPELPFGGLRQSGLGVGHGIWGFRTFSHPRALIRQRRGRTGLSLLQPPYTKRVRRFVDLLLRFIR